MHEYTPKVEHTWEIELGRDFGLQLENEIVMQFVWIAPGTFVAGSPVDEVGRSFSEKQFHATISEGFWIGRFPVTQAQWRAVTNSNPSRFSEDGFDRPVEQISWFDAVDFCARLNDLLIGRLPAQYEFALPAEIQWEYATRAGTQTRFYNGDSAEDLDKIAWYGQNSDGCTHHVGTKAPNAYGLYDTLGNVGEWCIDAFEEYPDRPMIDRIGTAYPNFRIVRGSAWSEQDASSVRCADRGYIDPDAKRPWFGMRACLRIVAP